MPGPTNYMPDGVWALPDLGGEFDNALQKSLLMQAQQLQLQRVQTQQQQLDAARQSFIAAPTGQNVRALAALDPQGFTAIKEAHAQQTTDQQNQSLRDTSAVIGQLEAGHSDYALDILQKRIDAGKKAGADTTAEQHVADLIRSDPKAAIGVLHMGLAATMGTDKWTEAYGKIGSEARDNAAEPGKEALTAAQAELAKANADAARYKTVKADEAIIPLPDGSVPPPPPPPPGEAAPGSALQPRGVRNNNPVNVTVLPKGQKWAGQTGSDGQYATFATPEDGMAAADKNLKAYAFRHGINTIADVVKRWAPAADGNDPAAYAATVAKAVGVAPDEPINLKSSAVRQRVLTAMSGVELGQPYAPGQQGTAGAAPASDGQIKPIYQGPEYGATAAEAPLSDEAVAMVGQQYLSMGPTALANMGQGKTGIANKSRVMNWVATTAREAGTSNPELVARFAQNKANVAALTQNTKALTGITSSVNTLDANLDFALSLAKRGLGPTGIPLADMPINKLRSVLGSADAKTLDNILITTGDEYARVLTSGPNGGGGATTEGAKAEAHKLLNNGMTLKQLISAAQAARTEGVNRKNAYAAENHRLVAEIGGAHSAAPGAGPAAGGPQVGTVQQGYRFNGGNPADPKSWSKVQ